MLEKTRRKMVKRYAADFWEMVKTDGNGELDAAIFPLIRFNKRLVFHFAGKPGKVYYMPHNRADKQAIKAMSKAKPGSIVWGLGKTSEEGKTVTFFGITRQKPEKLRQVIRHELIHSVLAQCGFPSGDNDEIFIKMAFVYNAL